MRCPVLAGSTTQLYLKGEIADAKAIFKKLKTAPVSPKIKFNLHFELPEQFRGEVVRVETTYCFIARDGIGDWIYAHCDKIGDVWNKLGMRTRVTFHIAFAFGGPNAFDVQLEGASA